MSNWILDELTTNRIIEVTKTLPIPTDTVKGLSSLAKVAEEGADFLTAYHYYTQANVIATKSKADGVSTICGVIANDCLEKYVTFKNLLQLKDRNLLIGKRMGTSLYFEKSVEAGMSIPTVILCYGILKNHTDYKYLPWNIVKYDQSADSCTFLFYRNIATSHEPYLAHSIRVSSSGLCKFSSYSAANPPILHHKWLLFETEPTARVIEGIHRSVDWMRAINPTPYEVCRIGRLNYWNNLLSERM